MKDHLLTTDTFLEQLFWFPKVVFSYISNLFIYLDRYVWATEQIVPFLKVWILN